MTPTRSKPLTVQPSLDASNIARVLEQTLYAPTTSSVEYLVMQLLRAIRTRLNLEVAFVSQFVAGRRLFRFVDSAKDVDILHVGGSDPLDESYCARVVNGQLPEMMCNAQAVSAAHFIKATRELPVGAHLSVPIRLSDGSVYGTFCAFSRTPKFDLDEKDLAFMRIFSDIAATYIERGNEATGRDLDLHNKIQKLMTECKLTSVFQPICRIDDGTTVGYEALTRVLDDCWPPDILFEQAGHLGLGAALGEHCLRGALAQSHELPGRPYLSLNATPEIILNRTLEKLLPETISLEHLVLEITEHDIVQDYQTIAEALQPLRQKGMRLAVDDAGAGYASFRHILQLKPDIIKLDISLIRNIDAQIEQQALTAALVEFSKHSHYLLVAEGVETQAELATLKALDVDYAQGYLLSRPYAAQHFCNATP